MRVVAISPGAGGGGYLVIDERDGVAAAVDGEDAVAVRAATERERVQLVAALATGLGGAVAAATRELSRAMPLRVYGNAADARAEPAAREEGAPGGRGLPSHPLGYLSHPLSDGDAVRIGRLSASVLIACAEPGEPVAYHFEREATVFVGDGLWGLGAAAAASPEAALAAIERMRQRVERLAGLAGETFVYGSAEATVEALELALAVEPENRSVADKLAWARARRAQGRPTMPTTLAAERATNPVFRLEPARLAAALEALAPAAGRRVLGRGAGA